MTSVLHHELRISLTSVFLNADSISSKHLHPRRLLPYSPTLLPRPFDCLNIKHLLLRYGKDEINDRNWNLVLREDSSCQRFIAFKPKAYCNQLRITTL